MAAARTAGAQINELAQRFGIHRATVIDHLERAGVPGRRRQGRTLSAAEVVEAGRLYEQGCSLLEVAGRWNVDRRYLSAALRSAGFAVRPPGRHRDVRSG